MNIFKRCLIFAAFLVFSMSVAAVAYAADTGYKLVVNGKELAFEAGAGPINRNGSIYVPLRAVFDALNDGSGALVWDGAKNQETLTLRGININFVTGSPQVEINGETVAIPDGGAPLLYNGAVYIPVRFFAGQFGMVVGWNELYSTVSLIDKVEYDEIQDLLANGSADIQRLSLDMALNVKVASTTLTPYSMNGSNINPDAGVLYAHTTTEDMSLNGSIAFDKDNQFAHVNMSLTMPGQSTAAEAYLLADKMYMKSSGADQWQAASLDQSPFDLIAGSLSSQSILQDNPDLSAVLAAYSYDPLTAYGLSADENGDLSVFGNIMLPPEIYALINGSEPVAGAKPAIPPIPMRLVYDKDTSLLKAIYIDLTISSPANTPEASSTVTVSLSVENINLSPGFAPAVPGEVVNNAAETDYLPSLYDSFSAMAQ